MAKVNLSVAHDKQSFKLGPIQVSQLGLHGIHR